MKHRTLATTLLAMLALGLSACQAGDTEIRQAVQNLAPGAKVTQISKTGMNGLMEITLESSGFLRHMVRNIAGTLVDVGRGKIAPERIPEILASRDRKQAGTAAPACGLFLKEVLY